jgi:hypothetical protein
MRKISLLIVSVLFSVFTYGQLSGIKTIPGDYATVALAIADLNAVGVAPPGVTFNIAAGYTETFPSSVEGLITATGTTLNDQIIFQKSGVGANPIITRADAGTLATSTLGGQGDAVFTIQGSDYITFDGIDAVSSNQGIEYGYYLRKASVTNGCKNIVIKNSNITLTKGTSAYVIGIYSSNNDAASLVSSATGITVTSTGGRNENISILGNTISNVFAGIILRGYNHSAAPYDFYDQNITVGAIGAGNTIRNFAGNALASSYGVYLIYQTSPNISYNTIDNAGGGGIAATSTLYGVFQSTTNAGGNFIANNNAITLSQGSTSGAHGIYNAQPCTSININNNTFGYTTFASTTTSYMIYSSNATNNITVNGNQTTGTITKTGAGTFYGYYNFGSPTGGTATITNNNFSNISLTGASGFYGIDQRTNNTQIALVNNNTISNVFGGTSSIYAIYQGYGAIGSSVNNNNVFNFAGAGAVYGIYVGTSASSALDVSNNNVNGLGSSGASQIYGIYSLGSTATNIFKNKVYNILSTNAGGTVNGIYVGGGALINVFNNYISDLKATSATGLIAIYGLNIAGGTTVNAYYNTVYLNAVSTSVTTFGTTGIYASTILTLDLRNNIVINMSTPIGATGLTCAYRRSSATLTTYAATANNNDFYAGTPGANNLIYYDLTNSDQTMAAYQARVAPRDAVSFTENPPFVNIATTPYDLHLQTTISTKCESGGVKITTPAITVDFDNNTRWGEIGYTGTGSTTDVGADEFDGIPSYTCAAPTPGNTVSTATTLCFGQNVTLSLQNVTAGTGVNYQWKSSTDNITYSNVGGATSATYSTVPTGTIYYQCVVTCQNGPTTATSAPVQLSFANSITASTPGTRCGTGSVVLSATGSAGTTLNWYDAAIGGTNVGTGSPFNTPSIATTTTFYVGAETFAPGIGTVGNGSGANTTSSYPAAYGSYWGNARAQYIVLASDLAAAGLAAGNLNSLAFDVTALGSPVALTGYTISIGNTALTTLSAFQPTTTVVYGPVNYTPVIGGFLSNNHVFTTPYTWNGTSNIIVDICFNNGVTGSTNSLTRMTNTGYNASVYYGIDGVVAGGVCANATITGVASTNRPNMQFGGTTACSSPRSSVIATIGSSPILTLIGNQNVCDNSKVTLNVTSTLADYDSYVWTPITNLYTDVAFTTPYVAGTNASTVYANAIVTGPVTYTCTANNSSTLCSNVATTTITTRPAVSVPTTLISSVSVCQGATTATITASASSAPVSSSYSFGLNLQSTGVATPFTITVPALPAGAVVTSTTLDIITANAINGSYRNEIRVALSGISTLAAYQISTLGSGGLVTPDPSITVPNIPAAGGSLTLTLSESYDDAGVTDATFVEIKLTVTYTLPLQITWFSNALAGSVQGIGSTIETVGSSVLPNTSTPGTYHFYAESFDGTCVSGSRLDVSVVVNPVLVALTPVNVTCNGGNNGSFSLGTVSCGTAPFTYSVNAGAFGPIPTNLTAGIYNVIAKDNGGNSSSPISVTVTEPAWTVSTPVAGLPVNVCQNATSAFINVTPGSIASPQTITIPFDVLVQPTEVNAAPGNTIATANLPAMPAGSTITSVVLSYPGLTALGNSWQADVKLGVSGSIADVAASGTGASNAAGLFNYTRTLPNTSVNLAGGSVNLLYWDAYNDNLADECTFTTGASVASITITYNPGSDVNWYTSNVGGSYLGSGASFEAVGTSVLTNTTTPGTYNFYAEGAVGTCISPARTLVTVTVNTVPTITLTSPSAVTICNGDNTNINLTLTGTGPWTWVGDDGTGPATFNAATSTVVENVAPTATTTYSIISVSDVNGCTSTSTSAVVVTVIPVSVAGTATPTLSTFCAGNGTTIALAGNTGNIQWQSSTDGTTWSDVIGETTATLATGNLASTMHYHAVVTSGICSSTTSNNVVITVNPLPTISLTSASAVSICQGGNTNITLALTGTGPWTWVGDDGSGPGTFNETSSPATANVSPTVTTTYSILSVTDANGCTNTSTDAVVVTVNTPPIVSFGPDVTFCSGNSAILDAGNVGSTYLWSDGSTNQTLTVTTTGIYSVTVTNANTCTAIDTVGVTFNTPAAVTITENTGVLTSDATTGNQWYDVNGIIVGETNSTYTPTVNGDYYVIVTDINGCTSTSNTISFVLSSSNIGLSSSLNIYPNPAKDNVFVEVSNPNNSHMSIELMSLDGRVLYENSSEVSGKLTISINLNEYASGIYMIKAVSENNTLIQKLIIQ